MARLIFVGSRKKYPIPDGECQIGSDSACEICVRGEGVLPSHAWLKFEGDKLLVRPASKKTTIHVDGEAADGPRTLTNGQTLRLGQVELKVQTAGTVFRLSQFLIRLWRPRAVRWTVYSAAALVLSVIVLRYFWFNEAWWEEQVENWVEKNLLREYTDIGHLEVTLLEGKLLIRDMRIPNKEEYSDEAHLLTVEEVRIQLDPWAFLKSWFTDVRDARVDVIRPRLTIERVDRYPRPVSNIDDILARLTHKEEKPFDISQLTELNASLKIHEGQVLVRDGYTKLPDSSLKGVELELTQPGFGEQLKLELKIKTVVGEGPDRKPGQGSIGLKGWFHWLNEFGEVDLTSHGDGWFKLDLDNFDLARLCRHMEWDYPVYAEEGKVVKLVPGKPVTGAFTIDFSNLTVFRVNGKANSESLVSVVEEGKPTVGNIPTSLNVVDLAYDINAGPTRIDIKLESRPRNKPNSDRPILDLHINGNRKADGLYSFEADLFTPLQDLFATDVGERLNLKDRLRGELTAHAQLHQKTQGEAVVRANAKLDKSAQVYVQAAPKRPGVWQPLTFETGLISTVRLNKQGGWSGFDAQFEAKAKSFEAKSATPHLEVHNLDKTDRTSANARFRLNLRGREFWTEFAPILGLLGFDKPIQEIFDLDVRVATDWETDPKTQDEQRRIGLAFKGTAERQWGTGPVPAPKVVPLNAILDFYPEAFAKASKAPLASGANVPYGFKLTFEVGKEATPIFVHARDVRFARGTDKDRYEVPSLWIKSKLRTLKDRFDPYLKRVSDFLGAELYEDYRVAGYLEQAGSFGLIRERPKGDKSPPLGISFDFQIAGEDLLIEGPLPHKRDKRWIWTEPKPQLALTGSFFSKTSTDPEEPHQRILNLDKLAMKGRLGAFELSAQEVNLWLVERLAARAAPAEKYWPDALATCRFSGRVEPSAFDLMRRLERLPPEPPVSGRLELNLDYDRAKNRLALKKLDLGHTQRIWLRGVHMEAEVRDVRELFFPPEKRVDFPLRHLGRQILVRSLAIDTKALTAWIAKYPKQARLLGLSSGFQEAVKAGTFRPHGTWSVEDLLLRPHAREKDPGRDAGREWMLLGKFRNDFQYRIALPSNMGAATLGFKGEWAISHENAAGISLSGSLLGVDGAANCDAVELSLRNEKVDLDYYRKKAGTPLGIALHGSLSSGEKGKDSLYNIENLAVKGGPLEVAVKRLQALVREDPDQGLKRIQSLTLGSKGKAPENQEAWIEVTGGFLPCKIKRLEYKAEPSHVAGQIEVPSMDLEKYSPWIASKENLVLYGKLVNSLMQFSGDPSHLFSANPRVGKEKVQIDGTLKDVTFRGTLPGNERLMIHLNGQYGLTSTELAFKKLEAAIGYTRPAPGKETPTSIAHRFSTPIFKLSALDPKQNVRQALTGNPPALKAQLPMQFDTEFNGPSLMAAIAAFKAALDGDKKPRTQRTLPAALLRSINLAEASLRAPALRINDFFLEKPHIPGFSMKNLALTIPQAKGVYAGGELQVGKASYRLDRPVVEHAEDIKLTGANLRKLLGMRMGPHAGYRVDGRVSLQGDLKGAGFGTKDSASWKGVFLVELDSFTTDLPPETDQKPKGVPLWAEGFGHALKSAIANMAEQSSVDYALLTRGNKELTQHYPWLNGTLLGVQIYLARLGLDSSALAFEKTRVNVSIVDGVVTIPRSELIGKGAAKGLKLAFAGRLRLFERAFDPEGLKIWAVSLPETAHQKLHLDRWHKDLKKEFLWELGEGKMPLRAMGKWSGPSFQFPIERIQRFARLALFNKERIGSALELEAGLNHLRMAWCVTPKSKQAAADLFGRAGFALPGTPMAKRYRRNILHGLRDLPPHLSKLARTKRADLTPLQALEKLVAPPVKAVPVNPPEVLPPGGGAKGSGNE